jgi:hypothetical protein
LPSELHSPSTSIVSPVQRITFERCASKRRPISEVTASTSSSCSLPAATSVATRRSALCSSTSRFSSRS